jgi:hypothetical protein
LHPTRLSPLEISGHTRFRGVSWRRLFPAPAARVKPDRLEVPLIVVRMLAYLIVLFTVYKAAFGSKAETWG